LLFFIIACAGGGVSDSESELGGFRVEASITHNFKIFDINRYEIVIKQGTEVVESIGGNLLFTDDGSSVYLPIHTIPVPIGDYKVGFRLYSDDDFMYGIITTSAQTINLNELNHILFQAVDFNPLWDDDMIESPSKADIYNDFTSDFSPFVEENSTNNLYIENGKLVIAPQSENDNTIYWWTESLQKNELGDLYVSFKLDHDITNNDGYAGVILQSNDVHQFVMVDFENNNLIYAQYNPSSDSWNRWWTSSSTFSTAYEMDIKIHYDHADDDHGYDYYRIFVNEEEVYTMNTSYGDEQNIWSIGIAKKGTHKTFIDNFVLYH